MNMQNSSIIALFGQAQKGDLHTMYYCKSVEELFHFFGEPPKETQGLFFAVQALLYSRHLIYFRVKEEGACEKEYLFGLHLLRDFAPKLPHVGALFLPQMGVQTVIDEGLLLCKTQKSVLLVQEADFYDYMTSKSCA